MDIDKLRKKYPGLIFNTKQGKATKVVVFNSTSKRDVDVKGSTGKKILKEYDEKIKKDIESANVAMEKKRAERVERKKEKEFVPPISEYEVKKLDILAKYDKPQMDKAKETMAKTELAYLRNLRRLGKNTPAPPLQFREAPVAPAPFRDTTPEPPLQFRDIKPPLQFRGPPPKPSRNTESYRLAILKKELM